MVVPVPVEEQYTTSPILFFGWPFVAAEDAIVYLDILVYTGDILAGVWWWHWLGFGRHVCVVQIRRQYWARVYPINAPSRARDDIEVRVHRSVSGLKTSEALHGGVAGEGRACRVSLHTGG